VKQVILCPAAAVHRPQAGQSEHSSRSHFEQSHILMKLPAAVDQRNMNPSADFACPFDDAETVINVDDDKPSSIDPSAAFAESLSQANAHLAEQTALLQTLVQATVTAGSKTEAAPAAASAPGSIVAADEESDSDDLEITSIEESEADDEDVEQAEKRKVMPQDDPTMPQHLRRAEARAYNQSLKVRPIPIAA